MCANYEPVTASDRMLAGFGVARPAGSVPVDFYPGYLGPFIRRARTAAGAAGGDAVGQSPGSPTQPREAELGQFGLVPHWSRDLAIGRRTYNARSESAAAKPSFRDAWRRGQRCIVPAEAVYEPCWESGRAVRWRIARADGRPLGIAGLWGFWRDPASGQSLLSYTLLTVNADGHAIFARMHRPGDEKRMVVILDEIDYDAWLDAPVERMDGFMRTYPAERLVAAPWPKGKR